VAFDGPWLPKWGIRSHGKGGPNRQGPVFTPIAIRRSQLGHERANLTENDDRLASVNRMLQRKADAPLRQQGLKL